jgi:hypothetical protein
VIRGQVDMRGLDALTRKLRGLVDVTDRKNMTGILDDLGKVIIEDNRRGVLSGLDMDGKPMPPLRYRNGKGKPTKYRPKRFGSGRSGLRGDNLTTAEYQKLTGPRLAPRRAESRVIRNLKLIRPIFERTTNGSRWVVSAQWFDVKTDKGQPILPWHFNGEGRNPRYDLRGVRPEGMRTARFLLIRWARAAIRRQLQGA